MDYFNLVKPTFIENWPKELCSLSLGQIGVKLSVKEAEALASNIIELGEYFSERKDISSIYEKLKKEVIKFPKGCFVRLGSRSPKDSLYDSPLKCFTENDVIQRLTGCSERILDDLSMAINNNYEPYIFLREWKEIPEWAEFRCFMKDRKLIGISQYNYLKGKVYSEIIENKDIIIKYINDFFEYFKQTSHLDNVIFDVYFEKRVKDNINYWEIKLLEINPFFELTDPCLFDWRKPENFKGQFLFNK